MKFRPSIAIGVLALAAAGSYVAWRHVGAERATAQRIDFSRDIRPILNQNCNACHGGVKQAGEVSFIYRDEALGKGKSGRPTIVPGKPKASELVARITSTDPELRMPLHAAPLPPEQVSLLKQWIEEGAEWEDHWAFVAPKPQTLPQIKNPQWARRPFDRFIAARLEKEGLQPSPEATKEQLLRRVSFDLTGLPPTPEELADFLSDDSADAYEKQVDRLLSSPHYGERWAAMWLDLARYADSRGYEQDRNRPMWPYRDWVIDAYNKNLPYDRFVTTQLAGDLLPGATYQDRIATAFQRLTPVNDEGGTDDEEYRLIAVMDRVATTWSTLNGVTINCVQCHSHPYDPIRHTEYYKFLAFYNTSRDADLGDDWPTVAFPTDPAKLDEAAALEQRRAQLRKQIVENGVSLAAQTHWTALPIAAGSISEKAALERFLRELREGRRKMRNPFPGQLPPEKVPQFYETAISQTESSLTRAKSTAPVKLKIAAGEAQKVGTVPMRSMFEVLTQTSTAKVAALRLEVRPLDPVKARHSPEFGFIVDGIEAWVVLPDGREQRIVCRYFAQDSEENLDAVMSKAVQDAAPADAKLASIGSGNFAASTRLFETRWLVAVPEQPLTLPAGSRLKVQLTHSVDIEFKPGVVPRLKLYTSDDARWTEMATADETLARNAELLDVERSLNELAGIPTPVMAEQESDRRRQTLEFERGNFMTKVGPALAPDMPAVFPKLPEHAARNRLIMAQWFFSPGQPLTARVAVNRYWEQLFGAGIVETLEDFGSSGLPPTHPELLDWLALHFQNDLHWNMKALLRELATSAAYRQSSVTPPALLKKDPRNQLIARGPQQRLTAEMVRDQALRASGLLTEKLGGESVMPPQPEGVWMTVYSNAKWTDATGPDRYRRAIYTYIKRSAVYPSFVTFDASLHDVSLARRIPTNTPLQALVTLNDPVYQEAATALARQMLAFNVSSEDAALAARLNYGGRRVLSRDLQPHELEALKSFYAESRRMPVAGAKSRNAAEQDRVALVATAAILMNLDAALNR